MSRKSGRDSGAGDASGLSPFQNAAAANGETIDNGESNDSLQNEIAPPQQQPPLLEPEENEGTVSYLRRWSKNAAKIWTEITTFSSEDRPTLVVNPRHHLRSHSISSYHTPSAGGDHDSIIEAFTEAAFGDGHNLQNLNSSNNMAEPLLLDNRSTGSGGDGLLFETPANEPRVIVATPVPPLRGGGGGMRERTTSGAFLSTETRIWAREMVRRAGNYLAYTTLLIMLFVVPVVTYHGLRNRRLDSAAFRSAGVMVLGTIVLSLRLVYLHLTHWYMPQVQKYVVRILWMVPLYSIQSWLSLRFHTSRIYIDTIRDYYEAYVIASFVYYLIELLGGEEALIQILQSKAGRQDSLGQHSFPLSLILEDWRLGEDFMLNCKHGVLQYVVFKSIATFITFICESADVYGEGTFDWLSAYPYMCFFQNISVMYALYSLVMLYSAVHEELRYPIDWRPLGKFLCIKGVVFFTWWQGVLIYYLKAHGIIENLGKWSSEDVANGLIDYCVVIEMVGFAIAHSYTFTYKEYLPSNIPPEFQNLSLSANTCNLNRDEEEGDTQSPTLATAIVSYPSAHSLVNPSFDGANEAAANCDSKGEVMDGMPPQSPLSPNRGLRTTAYHPPATLDRPMDFRDAFWSSAVPKDTIQDIQRLRAAGMFEAPRAFRSLRDPGEESGDNEREALADVDPPSSEATSDTMAISEEKEDEDSGENETEALNDIEPLGIETTSDSMVVSEEEEVVANDVDTSETQN
mmetsp:Transcript_2890/g.6151  ORF Transcript_2890/g.6151 Transcript_2890/m.6151 type:complete len:742 (+) Transcript_2890:246-2471(+)